MDQSEINDLFDSIANSFIEWERLANNLTSRELRQRMERHSFVLAHDFFNLGVQLMNHHDPNELFCGDSVTSRN